MVAEQVSSCQEEFSVSLKQMQNLVCAEWKCSGVKQIVVAEQSLATELWKYNSCGPPVKFSRCWVNP